MDNPAPQDLPVTVLVSSSSTPLPHKAFPVLLIAGILLVIAATSFFVYKTTSAKLSAAIIPTPALNPTLIPTLVLPTPTPPSATPTRAPTAVPTRIPTPIPIPETDSSDVDQDLVVKPSCEIEVDPSSGPPPLEVLLSYSVSDTGTATATGIQWDYDGDGNWDSNMSLDNDQINYTYSTVGEHTVKLHVKLSDGRTTDICTATIDVQAN
jgi:PKD repeat protein